MAGWFPPLVGLLLSAVLNISDSQALSFTPDQGMRVIISRQGAVGTGCTVCVGEGSKRLCYENAVISGPQWSVEFTCPNPHRFFSVDIIQKIVCKGISCSGDIIQRREPDQLQDFNRTYTWDLEPEHHQSFQLTFSDGGMRQVLPSETCPGLHTYTVAVNQSSGIAAIGTFCPNGAISSILAQSQGRLVLEVAGGQSLDPAIFKVSAGPEIKTLAQVKVVLLPGSSVTEFYSPNYPGSFPDDDLMTWDFQVPSQHSFTVRFLNYTEPPCVKKDVVVEYHRTGKIFVGKSLQDIQPTNWQKNFSFFLRNCEMERKATPGLALHFQVSVVNTNEPVFCAVDLRKEEGVLLLIKKKNSKSNCKMKIDSVPLDTIEMASGKIYKLAFQDCPSEDLMLTISKTIGCQRWEECPVGKVLLSAPTLQTCLPTHLHRMTWHLHAPEDGTVELLPPRGNLKQLLLGEPCKASLSLTISEDNGVTVGSFCPNGTIQKIQVHYNVSVTATPTGSNDLSQALKSFLRVSFSREIAERYIFTVAPKKDTSVLLATPSWPEGMSAYSTISWIVMVPPAYHANLMFLNVSQPKCRNRHTIIKVQTLGSREEMFSRREDEQPDYELSVPETFYLNMSNCLPEERAFSVLSQIKLKKSSNLGIILGAISGLLLLLVLVLVIVCVVIRKKKRQVPPKASIYNPNGSTFAPGHHLFSKSRADNESHIYASIEDTMVYGHLLKNADCPAPVTDLQGKPEVDVYRSFTGPLEAPPPPLPDSHMQEKLPENGAPEVDVYRPFLDPSESALPIQDNPLCHEEKMVENELYSPGSNGRTSPVSLTHSEQ